MITAGTCYFDTVGLNEAARGTVSATDAIRALTKLLKSLESGVNLIIFMIRKGRITDAMVKNYTIFVHGVCGGKVPVLLAISGCEFDADNGAWFTENKTYFEHNGMSFDVVISGCFTKNLEKIKPSMHQAFIESFEDTKAQMKNALRGKYLESHTFGTWYNWLMTVLKRAWNQLASFFGWSQVSLWDTLKFAFMRALGINETEATAMANELALAVQ